jgi:hypothetical protein
LKGMLREALSVILERAVVMVVISATGGRKPLSRPTTRHGTDGLPLPLKALAQGFPHGLESPRAGTRWLASRDLKSRAGCGLKDGHDAPFLNLRFLRAPFREAGRTAPR